MIKILKLLIALKIVGFIEFILGLVLLYVGIKLAIRFYKKHIRKR